ncbi:MAG TPA: hypothetical protein VJP78_01565 [Thermoleophilia bacterium]|nr:hypothetical protein [Thermoleophilia bacterium]
MDPRIIDACDHWRAQRGKLYYYGAEGPDRWDCSGLYRQGLLRGCLWPYGAREDRGVVAMWEEEIFARVPWLDRQPGDGVVFQDTKTGKPIHLVCILSQTELIGANGGFPPRRFGTSQQESTSDYEARLRKAKAEVRIIPHEYWKVARLGVIRPPILLGIDHSGGLHHR